ncbi:MAG: hypothetical protein ACR2RE_27865 [Geminicoccaceae bacterium]
MGYLIFQILVFLLLAALLGFIVGWLLRGSRFQSELRDLDARWRSKLGDVESERDRFAGEANQANEARAKAEASAADAGRLAETHDASLQQLRREHETKLGLLSDTEQRAGGLEKELADAKASLSSQQSAGGDAERLGKELAAANARASGLERDLSSAKEANGACKREVDRLEAEITELKRAAAAGDNALAATGPSGSTGSSAGGAGPSGALGLVGGSGAEQAAATSGLAESAGRDFQASSGSSSSKDNEENEGVRPEGLSAPRGGTADDLKKISGVGPKLEKTLNGLGIFHFSQIADFTPDHVAWVDKYLRFKGRIERENWIEQAKVLAAGGETEFSRRN